MNLAENFKVDGKWQEFSYYKNVKKATRFKALHASLLHRTNIEHNIGTAHEGCTVSDEFMNFELFAEWCSHQIGYGNKEDSGRNWPIDKDLLCKGNKEYGSGVCSFVPAALNALMPKRTCKKSKLPPGVNTSRNLFTVFCTNSSGKAKYIGTYKTIDSAFVAYKTAKELAIKERAVQFKSKIDPRVFNSLMNWSIELFDYM